MKINLNEGAHPIQKNPDRMNLNLRIKFKEEIDKMITSGIGEAVEELEWIIMMVISIKKDGRINICVYYRDLNTVCVIDPFPTPFTKEILEGVAGYEIYSFTDGFSGYHQVRISKEDQEKETFSPGWGNFSYTVMPFGLKNTPVVFSQIVVLKF
ncbi:hypothetical protein KI387_043858 [Taxus chinensis]|uniref:Reverse transcriptase domain-containing protein n=1 Tax=Taxus chinensis TaxID=29808 RepID=A0AA38CPF4_TAXCH|nr:hypothetical protein KI387_043858 [Taxus chinensis]